MIVFFFMACRAILIIAFPRVRTIYICVTCVSMHCICSQGSCVIPRGLSQLMGIARKGTHAELDRPAGRKQLVHK